MQTTTTKQYVRNKSSTLFSASDYDQTGKKRWLYRHHNRFSTRSLL